MGVEERIKRAREAWNAHGEGLHPDLDDLLILAAADLFAAVDERDALLAEIASLNCKLEHAWCGLDAAEEERDSLKKRVADLEDELRIAPSAVPGNPSSA